MWVLKLGHRTIRQGFYLCASRTQTTFDGHSHYNFSSSIDMFLPFSISRTHMYIINLFPLGIRTIRQVFYHCATWTQTTFIRHSHLTFQLNHSYLFAFFYFQVTVTGFKPSIIGFSDICSTTVLLWHNTLCHFDEHLFVISTWILLQRYL
jgi:hypothetical protein